MRPTIPLLLAIGAASTSAYGQVSSPVDTLPAASVREWNMEGAILGFLYTDTIALWNPSFTADHGNLHLEARYQWEDWRTASVWAGRNFAFGNELAVSVTPMAGLVFGYVNGAAPGYLIEAEWKSLYFYSSSEYVFDFADSESNFAYTWNELSVDLDHLQFGIVLQRLRPFQSELDVQKGMLLMREQGKFLFGMYLFNLGWTDPTVVLNLAYSFDVKARSGPAYLKHLPPR
jgi:hypothetical protein